MRLRLLINYKEGLLILLILIITSCSKSNDYISESQRDIPFAMGNPPIERVCDYPIVVYMARGAIKKEIFEKAKSCESKIIIRIGGGTHSILNDNGVGLDLEKFETRIKDFKGKIEPYIEDGTILAHFTIDEPHDCSDWGGKCPSPSEVDQVSKISKKYWPNLPTLVNTLPEYASRIKWEYTDIINFQYAYHKGFINDFVEQAINVLNDGKVDDISWSIMARYGGSKNFGRVPMISSQVLEIGKKMCSTGKGIFICFVGYEEELLDKEMQHSINELKDFCNEK
jgi:hypothetical protein